MQKESGQEASLETVEREQEKVFLLYLPLELLVLILSLLKKEKREHQK